jgi:DeoR/GlpR family transcriptional regulator of sugar metabolism
MLAGTLKRKFSFMSKAYSKSPAKLSASERYQHILQQLYQLGRVQVDALAQQMSTSEVTIRKDLTLLESRGLLVRRHGGAIAMPSVEIAESGWVTDDSNTVSNRKSDIAALAATLVHDNSRILIDFGTTTAAMIPHLANKHGLVVMTNSLRVLNPVRVLGNDTTLLLTGGTFDPHSESFQGRIAEQVLRSYDFDQLFIGCDGIDLQRGTTTFNELLGLSQVMAEVASEVVVVAESSKLGRRIPNLELPWSQIHCLVTDDGLANEARQTLEHLGVRVLCTSPDTPSA